MLSLLSIVKRLVTKAIDAARTDSGRWLLAKEVVVDRKTQLVVRLVVDFVLTKRDITYGKVVKISAVSGFKAGNRNVSLRI